MRLPPSLATLCLVLAISLARAGGAEIPFDFADGFILLKAEVAGAKEPLNLLLDSGAAATVLSLRAARHLHLKLGATEVVRGVGSETPAWHLSAPTAKAGGIELPPFRIAVDLSNADALCSHPLDGIVGVDFFAGRIVQIDFVRHRLRLLDTRADADSAIRLPMRNFNGVMCVPLAVNGSPNRWTRLDTGCNDALHWVLPRPGAMTPKRQVSIGFINDAQNRILGSVQLGRQTLHPVEISLHTQPMFPGEAGLLGIGILSQYLVTIDAAHRQLLLHEPSPAINQ
jgi:hypothetical protein